MKLAPKTKSGFITHFFALIHRPELWCTLTLTAAAAVVFSLTIQRVLSTAQFRSDAGDYLTAVLTGGVPHPTGYPLYLLLAEAAQRFFTGNPVTRQAMVSALPAAMCVGLAFLFISMRLKAIPTLPRLTAAVLAALCLTAAPLFWSQAVIVEVYALNALFTMLILLWTELAFYAGDNPSRAARIGLTALAWLGGLGLGNHRTILLAYPLAAAGIYALYKGKNTRRTALWCAVGWLCGLVTYAILPMRAAANPPVNWGGASTWPGFLWLVSGGDYGRLLFGIAPAEYLPRLTALFRLFWDQFGLVGCFAGLLGAFTDHSGRRERLSQWLELYLFAAACVMATGYKTDDSQVYLLPALLIFVTWIARGLAGAWTYAIGRRQIGWALAVLLCAQLAVTFPARFTQFSVQYDDLARYAQSALTAAAPGESLYPQTDGETFALWYYQYTQGLRPDVPVISRGLLPYAWYRDTLLRVYPGMGPLE
jgi:hypothetical protein